MPVLNDAILIQDCQPVKFTHSSSVHVELRSLWFKVEDEISLEFIK